MDLLRVGIGYDVHRLVADRPLFIGGMAIPCEKGLLGHSDADVLLHAIMNAILGALGLGDIGAHFPDTDPRYAGADSRDLLAEVAAMMRREGYRVGNIDSIIVAQAPKMGPHIPGMRQNIANILRTEASQINVKATTEEHLGFTGREEGIAAKTVACLYRR